MADSAQCSLTKGVHKLFTSITIEMECNHIRSYPFTHTVGVGMCVCVYTITYLIKMDSLFVWFFGSNRFFVFFFSMWIRSPFFFSFFFIYGMNFISKIFIGKLSMKYNNNAFEPLDFYLVQNDFIIKSWVWTPKFWVQSL